MTADDPNGPEVIVRLDGGGTGTLNDQPLDLPSGVSPDLQRTTALSNIRMMAAVTGRPISTRVVEADGSTTDLVVHAADRIPAPARTTAPPPASAPTPPPVPSTAALPVPSWLKEAPQPLPPPETVVSAPAAAAPVPPACPSVRPSSRQTSKVIEPEHTQRVRQPRKMRPWLLVAGVLVAASAGGLVVLQLDDGTTQKARTPASAGPSAVAAGSVLQATGPGRAPVTPPEGWSTMTAWSLPVASAKAKAPTVAAGSQVLAVLSRDRQLLLLDPRSGQVKRVFVLPDGEHRGVWLGAVDGRTVAWIQVGNQLLYTPADGSSEELTAVPLPANQTITMGGSSPLLSSPGGVSVIEANTVVPVALPPGTTALAADGATVTAASPTGSWWTITGGKPSAELKAVPPREGATLIRVAGAGQGRIAAVWTGPDGARQTVTVYDAATGRPLVSGDGPADQIAAARAWVLGRDGKAAALGPVVFDLVAAKTWLRAGFTPVIGWEHSLYGRTGSGQVVVDAADGSRPAVSLPEETPLPWGVSGGQLVLTANGPDQSSTVYSLPRTGGSSNPL